jgi:hypothetical protein
MQLKNKFKLKMYFVLSAISYLVAISFFTQYFIVLTLVYLLIMLSQYLLLHSVAVMLNIQNSKNKKHVFYLLLKMLLLLLVFFVASRQSGHVLYISIGIYTFQLIILILSIKKM